MKSFKQVFTNIPELENYNVPQDESYWKHWERKTYEDLQPVESWIDSKALYELARQLGYSGKEGILVRAMERLTNGADIGCKGTGRLPTSRPNAAGTGEFGIRVAEEIQICGGKKFKQH